MPPRHDYYWRCRHLLLRQRTCLYATRLARRRVVTIYLLYVVDMSYIYAATPQQDDESCRCCLTCAAKTRAIGYHTFTHAIRHVNAVVVRRYFAAMLATHTLLLPLLSALCYVQQR